MVEIKEKHGGRRGGTTHHADFLKLLRITEKWNLNYINKYPIIIWSDEIRGRWTRKKGKKLVA